MSEVLLPTWIVPEKESHEWLDEGSAVFQSAFAPGLAQRQSYGGLRLKLSRQHTVRLDEKAQLLSVLAQTRGRYNVMRTKVHFARRGSMSASEALTNNTFASGTTGWSTQATSISVSDRILRAVVNATGSVPAFYKSGISVTQYAPYVLRSIIYPRVTNGSTFGVFLSLGDNSGSSYSTTNYSSKALVSTTTTTGNNYPAVINDSTPVLGDWLEVPWCSLTRCALTDNGTNLIFWSDEIDNATFWAKLNSSVTANAATAPDGTTTGDELIENGAASSHYTYQTFTVASSAADYSFSVALAPGARTRAVIAIRENTGGHAVAAWFDLSNGTVGTVSSDGANFVNQRAHIAALGSTWYQCSVTGRKTNAATQLQVEIYLAITDGAVSYSGDGTSEIYIWRATAAMSSVPTRLSQTTNAASSGSSQTGGALHLKGLPASETGLLLPGDWFEINGELKQATAPLSSDAAGLGYLQFEPPLVRSPSDNDPVIVTDPMGKFLISNIKVDNEFGTQARVSYDLEHIYE